MPTIALVDDDRNILTSVFDCTRSEGYRIMTYTDGASALDGFKTSPRTSPSWTSRCPAWTAWETLRRLRQKSDMPVIFLTSKDEEIDELFRAQDGRRRFHPEAVLAATAGRAREGGAARTTPKDGSNAQGGRCPGTWSAANCAMDPERHTCTWKNEPVTLHPSPNS